MEKEPPLLNTDLIDILLPIVVKSKDDKLPVLFTADLTDRELAIEMNLSTLTVRLRFELLLKLRLLPRFIN
jgi:hypothetical protein